MKLVSLLLLSCAGVVFGQANGGSTSHYEVLKHERMFCIAGGFSGAVTPAGHSLVAIARQRDAAEVFLRLTHADNPTAQLFGMLGLKTIGSDQFNSALAKLMKDKSQITVLEGCIAGKREVGKVANEIDLGRWTVGFVVSGQR